MNKIIDGTDIYKVKQRKTNKGEKKTENFKINS